MSRPSLWRTVRLFVSSTFRDMHQERDHLVKVVFPRLREALLPHRVYLDEIDLRWGVTREIAENDGVADHCLRAVEECQPYFVGLLGEIYGFVPTGVAADSRRASDAPGRSLTEIEIQRGALLVPPTARRAFFCFRDPRSLDAVPVDLASLYRESNLENVRRLEELKAAIRSSGAEVLDGYAAVWDPNAWDAIHRVNGRFEGLKAFGDWIFERLWRSLRDDLGLSEAGSSAVIGADDAVERVIETRLRVHAERPRLHEELVAYVEGDEKRPLMVAGPTGSGKTTSLARLVRELRSTQNDCCVIAHFVGAGADSSELGRVLERVLRKMAAYLGEPLELPDDPKRVVAEFPASFARLSARVRVALVIDSIDAFDDADEAGELSWLPMPLPNGAKVLLSSGSHALRSPRALRRATELGWPAIDIPPLELAERQVVVERVAGLVSKALDANQLEMILRNQATGNPLFLKTALEELKFFAPFESINQRIAALPHPTEHDPLGLEQLFRQMVRRLEQDFGVPVVRSVLGLMTLARRGLTEAELRVLMGSGEQADDAFAVLRQLRPFLEERGPVLSLPVTEFVSAIRAKYPVDSDEMRSLRERLVEHFGEDDDASWGAAYAALSGLASVSALEWRVGDELPWQLSRLKKWQALAELLCDPMFFGCLWSLSRRDAFHYWAVVEANSSIRLRTALEPIVSYLMENPGPHQPYAELFELRGHFREALSMSEAQARLMEQEQDDPRKRGWNAWQRARISDSLGDLDATIRLAFEAEKLGRACNDPKLIAAAMGTRAVATRKRGDNRTAFELQLQRERLLRTLGDAIALQDCLQSVGILLSKQGDLAGAEKKLDEAASLCRASGHVLGLQAALGNRAQVLAQSGNYEAALDALLEQRRICERYGFADGLVHCLNATARVQLTLGKLSEALGLYEQTEATSRTIGFAWGLQRALGGQVSIHVSRNKLDLAEQKLAEQESICAANGFKPGLLDSLGYRAAIADARGNLEEALELLRRRVELAHEIGDQRSLAMTQQLIADIGSKEARTSKPDQDESAAVDLVRRAELLEDQAEAAFHASDLEKALSLLEQEHALRTELGNPSALVPCLRRQALIHKTLGRFGRALELYDRLERASQDLGLKKEIAESLTHRAAILHRSGELASARKALERQIALWQELDEPEELSRSLGNHALVLKAMDEPQLAFEQWSAQGELCRGRGDLKGFAASLAARASLMAEVSRHDLALEGFGQAVAMFDRVGDPEGRVLCRVNSAISLLRGPRDLEQAMRAITEAIEISKEHDVGSALQERALAVLALIRAGG